MRSFDGGLVRTLYEMRVLTEAGFTIQLLYPDKEGMFKDPEDKHEVILCEFWTDSSMTTLMLKASETALEISEDYNDVRLRNLMKVLVRTIEGALHPLEVEDVYETGPRKGESRMFPFPDSFFRFQLANKIRKDAVRNIASAVAARMQKQFPGLHVSDRPVEDLGDEEDLDL